MKSTYILKCPNCNADLDYEDGMEVLFCKYCGTKILLNDENTYTFKKVDVAEIQKAKNQAKQIDINKSIYDQEFLIQERELEDFNRLTPIFGLLSLALLVLGLLLLLLKAYIVGGVMLWVSFILFTVYMGRIEEKEKKNSIILKQRSHIDRGFGEHIEVTPFFYMNKGKNYKIVSQKFASLGFKNIECIPMEDLTMLTGMIKEGKVENVLIDGKQLSPNGIYLSNDIVKIYYHSK